MPTTDQAILSEVQRALLEPADGGATCVSPLWTPAEWLASLNARQRALLEASGLVAVVETIGSTGADVLALPATVAAVLRAAWVARDGTVRPLDVIGFAEADFALAGYPLTPGRPRFAVISTIPARQIRLVPGPSDVGAVHLVGVAAGGTVTGAGDALTLPDEWIEYLRYGVLEDALRKTGPAEDLTRAGYCAARVQEASELARGLLDELAGGVA